ncbi:N-acetylmuramoyl-L-alanine amidase family protein [Candidatus Nitrospira neomarina]|uniref:N-acetylmuramoyl-L-alanine amidase n=1 Tax=Candidatus Nitrospira neomarina TaxID=3020899 RepID=A0AA96GJ58_9BACT|nr:N-acetylmuramoyl-L-alanine amidase [Candidatus Nitrospira neomarina]WNM62901.1 N-acetylmuramoyl-L-alanine amidase [Candidatus Nitrospira neomarina]
MPSIRMISLYSCIGIVFLSGSLPLAGGATEIRPFAGDETQPQIHLIAQSPSSTSIRNIRAHRHKNYTRVVLDLTRSVHPAPQEHQTATTFELELPNTKFANPAVTKSRTDSLPLQLDLSTTSSGSILLSIPIEGWKRYKWYVLKNPARIVLDLYPITEASSLARAPDSSIPASPVVPPPTPPPPVIKKDLVIVIDPGHGGKDPGALGRKGTREKDVVLHVANHLRDLLAKESSTKVFMTRETDVFIELEDRATFANTHKADLFVSIHINSHSQSSVKGLEFYHFGEASDPRALAVAARENGTPLEKNAAPWQFILADKLNDKKIDDSRELAWTTKNSLVKFLDTFYKIKDHGIKTAPFFVLRMTTMPAILAEIAFISNPTEEKLLQSSTYQKRVAEGIFKGLQTYITPLQTASR